MNSKKSLLIGGLISSAVVVGVTSAMAIALAGRAAYAATDDLVLDYNEQTHLEFMREVGGEGHRGSRA